MKRYLTILIILFILMGVFNMDILGRSIKDIQARMTGQVDYRINVVKGVVESENINQTYNCYIAGETVIYPNIPTFSRNPKLKIGDKVTIEFINGCRETPCILAPEDIRERPDTTSILIKNVYVVYKKTSDSRYYLIQINDDDSITEISELTELFGADYTLVRILTDNGGNVYVIRETESTLIYTLYKYNSSGILQATKIMTDDDMCGAISPSGFLYTMDANEDEIHKRSLTTLDIEEIINLTPGHRYYYLCFDANGYLYTYDRDFAGGAAFVKWDLGIAVLESHIQNLASLSARADTVPINTMIIGNYWVGFIGTINMSLDSDMAYWAMNDIDAQVCGVGSNEAYIYVLGENAADNKLIVEKYNAAKVLQSTIDISADYIGGGIRRFHSAITAYPF